MRRISPLTVEYDARPAKGTVLVADINPGAANAFPTALEWWNHGFAYFPRSLSETYLVADDGVHGFEVWVTDGTAVGTHIVVDLDPGPGWGFLLP